MALRQIRAVVRGLTDARGYSDPLHDVSDAIAFYVDDDNNVVIQTPGGYFSKSHIESTRGIRFEVHEV
jgi:hypothetical protein